MKWLAAANLDLERRQIGWTMVPPSGLLEQTHPEVANSASDFEHDFFQMFAFELYF